MGCVGSRTKGYKAPHPHLNEIFVSNEYVTDFKSIFGSNGRSFLSGDNREEKYQVVLSFPGKEFDFKFTDEAGISAGSGFELAVWFHNWIKSELLQDSSSRAARTVYLDWLGLQYVPGTVQVNNYRGQGMSAFLNENWKLYYHEAMWEAKVMVVFVTKQWVESPYCKGEFEHVDWLIKQLGEKEVSRREMLFIVLENCSACDGWDYFQKACSEWQVQVLHYYENSPRTHKLNVEQHVIGTIREKCNLNLSDMPLKQMIEKVEQGS
mmetsp:Transcript_23798/g.32737  ORF Transcript_23798/g.32737 Transcript_23798/m.32737 type:complete len:265 (-) Transcript_23798:7-801(-)